MSDPYSAKPWLKFYDEHVPPNLEYPDKTYLAFQESGTKRSPQSCCLLYGKGNHLSRVGPAFG